MTKKKLALFGSTGSIGTQALEVVRQQKEHFEIEVLTAHSNADLLIHQAREFVPNVVVIGQEDLYDKVNTSLDPLDIKVYAGEKALEQVTEMESIDMVVMAIVGFAALKPLLAALTNKKPVALANKESMVVAGELIMQESFKNGMPVIPVDSEPSAIFQCLMGEADNPVEKVMLTASGGPFWDVPIESFDTITPQQALQHPNWKMGEKISIDSATLMNKGLEAIEIHHLFGLKPEQIEVLIHPQSIVHSLVQFSDGTLKAQMAVADMRNPIQYAIGFPKRLTSNLPRLGIQQLNNLHFDLPDMKKFRNLALAFDAMKKGGNMPCILNASNEMAVQAFLNKQIGFAHIPLVVEKCMQTLPFVSSPVLNDYIETDRIVRIKAQEIIEQKTL